MAMEIPGLSVLQADTPEEAATQIINAFPGAKRLIEKAGIVGSTTRKLIESAGFRLRRDPTRKFPNHHRIIHRDGSAGFTRQEPFTTPRRRSIIQQGFSMPLQVQILDHSHAVLATALVEARGDCYSGNINLRAMPDKLRQLFERYEEIVNSPVTEPPRSH